MSLKNTTTPTLLRRPLTTESIVRQRSGEYFELTRHAKQRMRDRSVSRHAIIAALSRPPVRLLTSNMAVFSAYGFEMLIDLEAKTVVTVLPKGGNFDYALGRDSGCRGHRKQRTRRRRNRRQSDAATRAEQGTPNRAALTPMKGPTS